MIFLEGNQILHHAIAVTVAIIIFDVGEFSTRFFQLYIF